MEYSTKEFESHADLVDDTECLLNDIMREIVDGSIDPLRARTLEDELTLSEEILCSMGAMTTYLRQRIDEAHQLLHNEF